MKNIIISYSKEQKNVAKKLVSKLESEGFSCWIEPRDLQDNKDKNQAIKDAINNSEILVLIFSNLADKTEELIFQYDTAFESEKKIIPYIVTDVEKTITVQHFLNTHHWINAYDASFEEATTNLIDLIQKSTGIEVEKNSPKNKTNNNTLTLNTTKKNYLIAGISVLILIIIGVFLFTPNQSSKWENIVVGKWKMIDYQDNMPRTKADSLTYSQSIQILKTNFSITFFKDKRFERTGFQTYTEKGKWIVDQQNKKLKLQAIDKKDYTDELAIESLSENKMVIVVAENTNDNQQVITKFTLEKQK